MRKISRGLVHRDRSAHRYADESVQTVKTTPGLVVVAAAMLAFVVCVISFALGEVNAGIAAAIIGLLGFGAGLDWLGMDRRRMRQAEREPLASHPVR